MNRLVAYYRVSTARQGRSGLGLEAQQHAVEEYAKRIDGRIVLPPFVEVESGKNNKRPQLALALERAKILKATLVVAKLDRLARNVAFLSTLIDNGVNVHFCDIPNSDRFTVHILAAVAEKEAKDISDRTKAALRAYKARGGKLGGELPECRNLTGEDRKAGNAASATVRSEAAAAYRDMVLPRMKELRAGGLTLQAIAEQLNADGYSTRRDKPWGAVQVMRALEE